MTLLYNVGLRILLLYLIINIAILNYLLSEIFSVIVGLPLIFNTIVASVKIIFWGLSTGVFFFSEGILS